MKRRIPKPTSPTETHDNQLPGRLVMEVNDYKPQDLTRKVSLRRYTLSGAADSRRSFFLQRKYCQTLEILYYQMKSQQLRALVKSLAYAVLNNVPCIMNVLWTVVLPVLSFFMFCVPHSMQTQIDLTKTKLQEMIGQTQRKVEEIKS